MTLIPFRPAGRMLFVFCAWLPATLGAFPLSFTEAQQVALSQSRQLVAQDAAITAASARVTAAGERPDPILSLGVDNLPVNGGDGFSVTRDFMTMRRIGLAQEFTRGDKLALRSERQRRETAIAEAGRSLTRSEILRDAGKAWLTSHYLQEQRELLDEQLTQARQQRIASEAAYRGGHASQADALAARAEVLMLEDRLQDMARQLSQARTMLARWVGDEASRQPLLGKPDLARTHLDAGDLESHLTRHPDLILLERRIALADADVRLAEAARRADWTAELSYAQRGPAFSDMVSVGLSRPLQWDQERRQNRELVARQAQVEAARATRDDLLRAHVAEVRSLLADWQSGRERLVRYRDELVPLAQSRAQATLAAWRGGRGALTEVLAARRAWLDMRLQASQLEMQTALVWADLEFLLPAGNGSTP